MRNGFLRQRWLVASAVASVAGSASAAPKLQFVGEGSLGWTDNISSSPDEPVPEVPEKQAGMFAMLAPGLVLALGTPRIYHRVAYTYTHNLYFSHGGSSGGSHRLEYRGFYDLTPRTDLVLTSALTETPTHMAGLSNAPGATDVTSVLSGEGMFLAGSIDEALGYDVSPRWRAWQGAGAMAATPVLGAEAPRTMEGSGRLGIEHLWPADALGVEGGARYLIIDDAVLPDGTPAERQRQLIGTGVLRWRHDWGMFVTSAVEAGVMRVERLNSGRGFTHPTGVAAVGYATEDSDAELSYAHRVTTVPLLGQSMLADEVRLRGSLALMDKRELVLSASAGYQRGRLINEDATRAAKVDSALIDVGLGWRAMDELVVGPRFQHARQVSDAERPPLPLSYVRNTVLIGARLELPPDTDMPRAYRAPRRVDRSDEVRDIGRPGEARR